LKRDAEIFPYVFLPVSKRESSVVIQFIPGIYSRGSIESQRIVPAKARFFFWKAKDDIYTIRDGQIWERFNKNKSN
jgi:hypothetical protein